MTDSIIQTAMESSTGLTEEIGALCRQSPLFLSLLGKLDIAEFPTLFQPEDSAVLPDRSPPWVPAEATADAEEAMRRLRQCKHRGMAHQLWWELGIHGDIETSARHLAIWAGGLLQYAVDAAEKVLEPRFGTLSGGRFTIIGLGKLGGMELNIGSDVDLLFIWSAPKESISSGRKGVPAREYYQQLSRTVIRLMSEVNAHGVVWPVDMRLRPGGDGAAVCLNLNATLDHYCNYGQTWERAMLIKARPVAGDIALGETFIEEVRPFVFRRYLDYTTVQALAKMKQRIDAQGLLHAPGAGFDVKRGRGGIREIEFFIQSMQLLHGGRNKALRVCPSMAALQALLDAQIISDSEFSTLRRAYREWRKIEHAIQARRGEQTHALPADYATYLAAALNIDDVDEHLHTLTTQVHALFTTQFAEIEPTETELRCNWLDAPVETIEAQFPQLSPEAVQRTRHALQQIDQHLQRGLLPERSREQVERILCFCMELWRTDANAATATESLARLLQNIAGRATWVDLLAAHEGVLSWLAGMLSASRYIADQIADNPSWLEWSIESERGESRIQAILSQFAHLDPGTLAEDEFLTDLGRLIDQIRLTAAVEIASNDNADPLVIGNWLAESADRVTQAALRLALKQYDLPDDFPLVAVAMGKHGCRSMGLVSDLDMVFILVHDDPAEIGPKGKSYREWSQRVGRRMIQHLTLQPPFGAGFEFDARLRPSGASGILVTTIEGFCHYQMHDAQTWEHQALCRARPVTGSDAIRQRVADCIRDILRQPRDASALKKEILTMRRKMEEHLSSSDAAQINLKQDAGGLVDIEFLAQYARLAFGGAQIGTVPVLQNLPADAPEAWHTASAGLIDAFLAYRRMENALRVHLWASVGRLPANDEASEWETLRRHAPIKSVDVLKERMKQTRKIFLELLN